MAQIGNAEVESEAVGDFARILRTNIAQLRAPDRADAEKTVATPGRLNLDPEKAKNGLAQLVLTLIRLLHELLERQGMRRIEAGSLHADEVERLGVALMRQSQEIERMRVAFGLEEEDLNIDLGPLGRLF